MCRFELIGHQLRRVEPPPPGNRGRPVDVVFSGLARLVRITGVNVIELFFSPARQNKFQCLTMPCFCWLAQHLKVRPRVYPRSVSLLENIRLAWKKWQGKHRLQGILNGEVSLYHWPLVWLVWNQLYDYWQFMFLFAKHTNSNQSNRRSIVQWYFPFSIPCSILLCPAVKPFLFVSDVGTKEIYSIWCSKVFTG